MPFGTKRRGPCVQGEEVKEHAAHEKRGTNTKNKIKKTMHVEIRYYCCCAWVAVVASVVVVVCFCCCWSDVVISSVIYAAIATEIRFEIIIALRVTSGAMSFKQQQQLGCHALMEQQKII